MIKGIVLVLIIAHLQAGYEARSLADDSLKEFDNMMRNDYYNNPGSTCKCSDESCECCSKVGPSKMCNMVKMVNAGPEKNLALELSVHIGKSKIFSQNVTLKELKPLCYPYGDYNLCVQMDHVKSQQENDKICGNFLAKQKAYGSFEESILIKKEIFCLPFESHQLNKHVLQLLRFVSQ